MIHRLEILNVRDRYMINDWLMEKDEPIQWESADYCRSSLGMKDITPIPLTEEILQANGFEVKEYIDPEGYSCFMELEKNSDIKGCSVIFMADGTMRFNCFYIEDKEKWYSCNVSLYCRHYVHELQHTLRLCGLNDVADNFKVE